MKRFQFTTSTKGDTTRWRIAIYKLWLVKNIKKPGPCGTHNFARNTACRGCGSPKPAEAEGEEAKDANRPNMFMQQLKAEQASVKSKALEASKARRKSGRQRSIPKGL